MLGFNRRERLCVAILYAIMISACGGGSSGTSSSSGGDSGTTTVTTSSLSSVSTLPDFDIDSLDVAVTSSTSASISALSRYTVDNPSTEYSIAGCELREQMNGMKEQVKNVQSMVCMFKAMGENTNLTIPSDGTYSYYSKTFSAEETGEESSETSASESSDEEESSSSEFGFRLKVGVVDDVLHIFACTNETGDYAQMMAITGQAVDGKLELTATESHPSYDDPTQTDARRLAISAPDVEDVSELTDGDVIQLAGSFNSAFGSGVLTLNALRDGDTFLNTLAGGFHFGNPLSDYGWAGALLAETDFEQGCANFATTGSQPAQTAGDIFPEDVITETGLSADDLFCWVEPDSSVDATTLTLSDLVEVSTDGICTFTKADRQCFSYDTDADGNLLYYTLADELSAYAADDFLSGTPSIPDAPDVSFTAADTWDCTAEGDFTELTVNEGADMAEATSTCFSEKSDAESGEHNGTSCFERSQESQAQETAGTDLGGDEYSFEGSDDSSGGDSESGGGDSSVGGDECTDTSECSDLGSNAVCAIPQGGTTGMCTITCTSDAECTALHPGLSCAVTDVGSVCVMPPM